MSPRPCAAEPVNAACPCKPSLAELAVAQRDGLWLAVASFVNPHDISFGPTGWRQLLGFGAPDDSVPEIPEAPSHADEFTNRPSC